MCGNATRDKWKPTSVKYVTSRQLRSLRSPNISNIKWLLIDLKIVQLSMLQTQHMSVAEGVCNNYRSPSHAYLWTTPEDFIHLLHEGLMLIVCYIKPERSEGRENSCTFSVSSQGRKRINQVQTSLAHENVTVVWPDVLWKTRIISLRLPQHQQDWYVPFSKICKLTRFSHSEWEKVLHRTTALAGEGQNAPSRARRTRKHHLRAHEWICKRCWHAQIIEGGDRPIRSAILYTPCSETGNRWRSEAFHYCYAKPSWGWTP